MNEFESTSSKPIIYFYSRTSLAVVSLHDVDMINYSASLGQKEQ